MCKDPIVEEVRKAGEELTLQANYGLYTLLLKSKEKRKET